MFAVKDLPFSLHFLLQGEGISCRAVFSNVEVCVCCSSAGICMVKTQSSSLQRSEPLRPVGDCDVTHGKGLPSPEATRFFSEACSTVQRVLFELIVTFSKYLLPLVLST